MCNSDLFENESSSLDIEIKIDENEMNHQERAVDVDGIVTHHRRWRSQSRNVLKKVYDQEKRVIFYLKLI